MDMKITRNYAAYQNAVSSAKHTEKSVPLSPKAAGKARGDLKQQVQDGTYQVSAKQIARRMMSGL